MENAIKVLEDEIKNQQGIIREKVESGESLKEHEMIIGEMLAAIEKLKPIELNMDFKKILPPGHEAFASLKDWNPVGWDLSKVNDFNPSKEEAIIVDEDCVVSDTTDFSELFKNCHLKDLPQQGIKYLDTEGSVQRMFKNAEKNPD